MREHLEPRAVRLAAEDGAGVRPRELGALLGAHAVAAVADRPVDAAVRALHQPVHVVPAKRDAHPEARERLLAHVRHAGAARVAEAPQVRDARVPEGPVQPHHAGARAVERLSHVAAEVRGAVGRAVAVRVHEPHDAVLLAAVVVHAALALGGPFPVHPQAVLDGLQLQVVLEPEAGGTVVLDALLLPEALGDVDRAVVADAEGDGVLDERVAGDQRPAQALGGRDRRRGAGRGGGRCGARGRRLLRGDRQEDLQCGGRHAGTQWYSPGIPQPPAFEGS